MTLRQALDLALAQNPDLMLARLDQQKARHQITIATDPFHPKVFAGSGAAYTTGFPASRGKTRSYPSPSGRWQAAHKNKEKIVRILSTSVAA